MSGAARGYRLVTYVAGNHEAEALETCLDQWLTIWQQRGEHLPDGARFEFQVCPDRETIDVRVRIVLAEPEDTRTDRQCWQDVQRAIATIGRPELTDDALIRDLLGPGGIYVRIGELLKREDPA
jgi:hypothetical protein